MSLKVLALLAGLTLLGVGALSVWIIVKEGSVAERIRSRGLHKLPPKPHKR